jgi:hypothetical protein
MGARATGLAYSSSTLSDEWSLLNNAGGLAKVNKLSTAFAYEISPALPGANRIAAIVNSPFGKIGTAGIGFFRFGDELYSEHVISGGFSNQFGITSLGIKVNYIQYRAQGFGTKRAWSFNFGGITQLTPKLSVGAYITNINQPEIATQNDERIPASLTAGVGFKPTDKVLLLAEVKKDLEHDATVKGALEYTVHKKVFFRTGFNVQPNASFFGIGYLAKRLKIDYGLQYNNAIGLNHQASAIYQIEKRKKSIEQQ